MIRKIINNYFIKKIISIIFKFISDEQILKLQYRILVGRKLNLHRPKRFTEKMQWYKLYYRNPLMTQCVDKYRVREYILDKGYGDTLVNLYQVCETFEEINFDILPNQFVIKSNKGSGTNIFVRDKNLIDYKSVKKEIKSWNMVNTVLLGREWPYEDVKPKIVIEELLVDNKSRDIKDYKFLCFNGIVKYIWVDSNRDTNHKRNFYDLNWNLLDVKSDVPVSDETISKPEGFDYMVEIAESIGQDFPFVRVDFYWVNGKVYFGEITFYPWSGCVKFTPDKFDFELGNNLILPNKDKVNVH